MRASWCRAFAQRSPHCRTARPPVIPRLVPAARVSRNLHRAPMPRAFMQKARNIPSAPFVRWSRALSMPKPLRRFLRTQNLWGRRNCIAASNQSACACARNRVRGILPLLSPSGSRYLVLRLSIAPQPTTRPRKRGTPNGQPAILCGAKHQFPSQLNLKRLHAVSCRRAFRPNTFVNSQTVNPAWRTANVRFVLRK